MKRICAKCGKPEEPGRPFIGNLCLECYLEEKGVARIPGKIEVVMCPRCNSIKLHGAWLPPEHDPASSLRAVVEAEILSQTRPNPEVAQIWIEHLDISMEKKARGTIHLVLGARFRSGVEARYEAMLPLLVRHVLCPTCMRRAGKSYEAILQLRGEKGRLEADKAEEISRLLRRLPPRLYETIGDVEERREGLDLKILDQASARSIAARLRNMFAAKVVETHRVVGRRRDGKARVQTTILVRVPRVREGDVVIYKGEPAVITGISGNKIMLEDTSGRRLILSGEEFWSMGGLEIMDKADSKTLMVTAVTRNTVYLMDMDGYSMLEAPLSQARLAGSLRPGDKVRAVVRNGRVYILGKI